MNTAKLEALATRLENWNDETYGRSFNMSVWIEERKDDKYTCGIAGDVVLSEGLQWYGVDHLVFDKAKSTLDLSHQEASWLFLDWFNPEGLRNTPQLAARAVRLLISEGSHAVDMSFN